MVGCSCDYSVNISYWWACDSVYGSSCHLCMNGWKWVNDSVKALWAVGRLEKCYASTVYLAFTICMAMVLIRAQALPYFPSISIPCSPNRQLLGRRPCTWMAGVLYSECCWRAAAWFSSVCSIEAKVTVYWQPLMREYTLDMWVSKDAAVWKSH